MNLQPVSVGSLNLQVRKWVFNLFFNQQLKNNYCNQFERFITYMIVLNMAGLVLEHIPVIYDTREQ